MDRYSAEQIKWFQNWEKSIDNALKAIKKCREEMEGAPRLSDTTRMKYHLYSRLLEAEAQELVEEYEGRYPECKTDGEGLDHQ